MSIMSELNGFEIADKKVREEIEKINKTRVTPQMYGAKGDGVTDDTAAIQAALDASDNIYFPDGVYMINAVNAGWGHTSEGGIRPRSNTTITLAPNAVLKCIPNDSQFYNIIGLVDVENVTISGGKVLGDRDEHTGEGGEWGCGIFIGECNRIRIENVEISKCWGDGMCVESKDGLTGENNNISIDSCIIHDCRRQGISWIIGGKNNSITNCHIYDISGTMPQSGIDIEPNNEVPVTGLVIDGCTIHGSGQAGVIFNRAENCHLSNCNLDSVIYWTASKNNYIDNCHISKEVRLFGDDLNCNNCSIGHVACSGGSGKFSNCNINNKDKIGSTYSVIATTNDGDKVAEYLTFDNCIITANGDELYGYMWFQNRDRVKFTEFTNCEFHNISREAANFTLSNNTTRFTNCGFHITGNVWSLIDAGSFSPEITIEGCSLYYDEGVNIIDYLFAAKTPFIVFRNNNFPDYINFLYTDSADNAGKIIAYNNYGEPSCYISFGTFVNVYGSDKYEIYESGYGIDNDNSVVTEEMLSDELKLKYVNHYATPQMFGAKGDGVTDDTQALRSAFEGSSVVYIPDGTYLTSAWLYPQDNSKIILSPKAIIKTSKEDGVIFFWSSKNATISGGTIDGNIYCTNGATKGRFEHCTIKEINYWNATDFVIDNCTITDHIYLRNSNLYCGNSTINSITCAGGGGKFSNCNIKNETTGKYAVLYGSSDAGDKVAEYLIFDGCTFTPKGDETYGYVWFQNGDCVENTEFINCEFYNISKQFTISNKTTRFANCGFHVSETRGELFSNQRSVSLTVIIEGCTLHGENVDYIMSLHDPLVIFRNNRFSNFKYLLYSGNTEPTRRIIVHDNFCSNTEAYRVYQTIAKVIGSDNFTINEHDNVCE